MKKPIKISLFALLIEAILIAVLYKHWEINLASVMPIAYPFVMFLRSFWIRFKHSLLNFKYDGKSDSFKKKKTYSKGEVKEDLALLLTLVPFILPFVFFFDVSAKTLLSMVMIILWCAIIVISSVIQQKKLNNIAQKEAEAELKKQIQREEMGHIE